MRAYDRAGDRAVLTLAALTALAAVERYAGETVQAQEPSRRLPGAPACAGRVGPDRPL
jgi:hypothetical protein